MLIPFEPIYLIASILSIYHAMFADVTDQGRTAWALIAVYWALMMGMAIYRKQKRKEEQRWTDRYVLFDSIPYDQFRESARSGKWVDMHGNPMSDPKRRPGGGDN